VARLALAAVAFAVTAAVTPLMTIVARRTGIVDRPGALKVHEQAVPYLGGVAVFAGLAVSGRAAVLVPCALALALGVWDDARGVAPLARFLLEIPVGVAVAVAVPTRLPGPLGPALVVVATVALINAVNMLDGIDALAAGVGLAAAAGFAFLHLRPAAALAGALAGFLLRNRPGSTSATAAPTSSAPPSPPFWRSRGAPAYRYTAASPPACSSVSRRWSSSRPSCAACATAPSSARATAATPTTGSAIAGGASPAPASRSPPPKRPSPPSPSS
jgi:hypothetical protein